MYPHTVHFHLAIFIPLFLNILYIFNMYYHINVYDICRLYHIIPPFHTLISSISACFLSRLFIVCIFEQEYTANTQTNIKNVSKLVQFAVLLNVYIILSDFLLIFTILGNIFVVNSFLSTISNIYPATGRRKKQWEDLKTK